MNTILYIINLIIEFFFIINFNATPLNANKFVLSNIVCLANVNIPFLNHKSDGTKVVDNTKKNDNLIHTKNSIKKIWEENDGLLNITAELVDDKQELKIFVYNMLGKEVRNVYQGLPKNKNDEGYYIFTSETPINLPKNIYILVIQCETFKIADKFIIAK